jgi:phospholipase/lecithinase/hemolysin
LPVLATVVFSSQAKTINAIYAFGDSLSDAGNAFIASGGALPAAPYVNGEFSNGPVWVQDAAKALGLPAVTASLAGGTDYAVGGALSGNLPGYSTVPGDLPSQLAAFHGTNPVANPNGLYTIWIGSNDLNAILATHPSSVQAAADIAAVTANIDSAISILASEGAKNFLVVTVPDLGKTPAAIAGGPLDVAAASGLSFAFDNLLVNGSGGIPSLSALASADSLSLNVVDTYSLLDGIIADPGAYGLSNVTSPCLTGEVNYAGGTPCANPSQYLFWDQEHPTAVGQALVADAVFQTLAPEPSTLTMLGFGLVSMFAGLRLRQWTFRQ